MHNSACVMKNRGLDVVKYYFTKPDGFVKMLGVEQQGHLVLHIFARLFKRPLL